MILSLLHLAEDVGEKLESSTKKLDELFEKISNELALDDECKSMEIPSPAKCFISDNCLNITCHSKFSERLTTLTFKFNRYMLKFIDILLEMHSRYDFFNSFNCHSINLID